MKNLEYAMLNKKFKLQQMSLFLLNCRLAVDSSF